MTIHRWRAFAVLAVAYFMTIVDLTMVNVSLPTTGRDSTAQQLGGAIGVAVVSTVAALAVPIGGLVIPRRHPSLRGTDTTETTPALATSGR